MSFKKAIKYVVVGFVALNVVGCVGSAVFGPAKPKAEAKQEPVELVALDVRSPEYRAMVVEAHKGVCAGEVFNMKAADNDVKYGLRPAADMPAIIKAVSDCVTVEINKKGYTAKPMFNN